MKKISLKVPLVAFCIVGIVFSTAIIFFLTRALSGRNFYTEAVPLVGSQWKQDSVSGQAADFPAHLNIPKINTDAAVLSVGLTSDGAMDVPKGPADVAWYKLGPRPGEIGSAVISGHFGWKDGIPAVFDHLNKLKKGDKLYIEDEKGMATTFVVRGSRIYGENESALDVFGSSDGKAHLNLITCEGTWNKITKSYSNRLVVFADKE